jgi:predicted Zn-dependent protease
MALLSRAGFDPEGMPSFFQRLHIANRLTDPKFLPEFLRTHPVTTSRIADSKNRLAEYPPHDHINSDAYKLTKARIEVVAAKSPRHAVKIFKAALSESVNDQDATHYGYALALTGVGKYEDARHELEPLLKKDDDNVSYLLAMADLETKAGSHKKGLRIYSRLNGLYPNYRPVVMAFTTALLQFGQIKQAKALLLDYGIKHGTDRIYYELLAEAEGREGSTIEAHLALAEYHYLSGETELALNQLKIAERSGRLDYYHKQRLLVRLEQIEKELEAEKELLK